MIDRKTTLVLGAGASVAFGYPLGWELRKKILGLARGRGDLIQEAELPEEQLLDFVQVFEQSQMASIDAFLARRPEFGQIGKLTISALLLEAEAKVRISGSEHEDTWYQYLLNRLLPDSWEELDFEKLSVVTFNYDRSFEHYLLVSLQAAYGKTQEEVLEKLSELKVVHIYGSLGPPLPTERLYLPYGHGPKGGRVRAAAKGIRVIPEGRIEDEALANARDLLASAQAIGFLGFGFDPINCERLQLRQTCANLFESRGSRRRRPVIATCLGMTPAEALSVSQLINTAANSPIGPMPRDFYDANCVRTLRESLLLGR